MFDRDFFALKKLVMPVIIQRLFWIGIAFTVIAGIAIMVEAR